MSIQSGSVVFHDGLRDLLVDIDSVHPSADNYNNGDVDEIMESIRLNGMYRPVYVHRDTGDILAGNHTWMACKELNAQQIPVVLLDGDRTTALRIMVGDNGIPRLAKPDDAQLLSLLQEINQAEGSIAGTGYTENDVEMLKALVEVPVDHDEFASWPLLTFRVPPHVKAAFMAMTSAGGDDRTRFEMMLRMAGWDGSGKSVH